MWQGQVAAQFVPLVSTCVCVWQWQVLSSLCIGSQTRILHPRQSFQPCFHSLERATYAPESGFGIGKLICKTHQDGLCYEPVSVLEIRLTSAHLDSALGELPSSSR